MHGSSPEKFTRNSFITQIREDLFLAGECFPTTIQLSEFTTLFLLNTTYRKTAGGASTGSTLKSVPDND